MTATSWTRNFSSGRRMRSLKGIFASRAPKWHRRGARSGFATAPVINFSIFRDDSVYALSRRNDCKRKEWKDHA